ncbi:Chorismate synthase (fragment) [Bartonella clarridgeiae 73]|uniref:Chorismate synthase n=1 Tax=Bartonella clarridgeiae (strain CCUG 45776 / CIP 104772 / 73) TaxID=696125 RepID=E6YGX0_BARC7
MSHNTFGHLFRVTTWGESHGVSVGCVIDGCPRGISFTLAEIQAYLDKRRPGQSKYTTRRQELDQVEILSGVVTQGDSATLVTTGTPVSILIRNTNQRSEDYDAVVHHYRPGHADFTYDVKYGIRDYRGGGHASVRETVARVAAGAFARKVVPGLIVRGAVIAIGPHHINRSRWNWSEIDNNSFFTPDAEAACVFAKYMDKLLKDGSSAGAVVEIIAENVPPGLGAPIYAKLDQDIASFLMSINAIKGVEIGDGFAAALLTGKENVDEMRVGSDEKPLFYLIMLEAL